MKVRIFFSLSLVATAYEVYFAEDWKDLQESMLSKITSKALESSDISKPKPSGEKEQATFKLPTDTDESKSGVYYIAVRGMDDSKNRGKISNCIQVAIGYDKLRNNTHKNITGNETETTTDAIDESNDGTITLAKCYMMLGGSAAVFLLILIINVIIWSLCFRKHKKRWKGLRNTAEVSTSVKGLAENVVADDKVHHSYTNPIMERSRNVEERNGVEHSDGYSDPSAAYAKVVKKDKRDRDIYQMGKVGKQENVKHSERDLGLV